ncbi:MAG: hypothetical protein IPM71_01570 [Bacteroidota bacterium]|nr:MAG: hypothetical protein IPM71_01570 [Bacteroidota bacterium]
MKRSDYFALLFVAAVLIIFIIPSSRLAYNQAYAAMPVILSFVKFAVLATFGEMLILRLFRGRYNQPGFGLFPKAMVWGVLGISLYLAFTIFYGGVSWLLFKGGEPGSNFMKLVHSFSISFFMNIFYAPVLMTAHHISDRFIANNGGKFPLSKFRLLPLLQQIDWEKLWGFVIKKTIPLFWIPIHTITFLLPEQYRILIAALLSIVLGLFLATTKKASKS